MSAEAVRSLQATSTAKGMRRFVLMAIAAHSKHRRAPFWSKPSYKQIAAYCGISERSAKRIVAELIADGHLAIVEPGGGQAPNLYDLAQLRGVTLSTPAVSSCHHSVRGKRYTHTPARRTSEESEALEAIDAEYGGAPTTDIDIGVPTGEHSRAQP